MSKQITLLPLLGSWHLHYPTYNAVSLLELTLASEPECAVLAPLAPGALASPAWQETPEVSLPLAVVPGLRRAGVPLREGLDPSPDPTAEADFYRYAAQYPKVQARVQALEHALRPLRELLGKPLTLARVWDEVYPLVNAYQHERGAALGDGPATDWWRERHEALAERIRALPETRLTLLASIDQLPFLTELLGDETLELPREAPVSTAARERALLDIGFRGDAAEPGALIAQLRTLEQPEARFHEASLLLTHGHLAEALERVEALTRGDFSQPYFLPGFALARLGQLCDLSGNRAGALRAYRGVLALEWVPPEAAEAARAGLKAPFEGLAEGL